MQSIFKQLLQTLGENPNRDGLLKTPQRAAEAMTYLTKGYNESLDEVISDGLFESDAKEMVLLQDVEIYSLCEHHLLPFFGKCHVAYVPHGKILGLSEIVKVVEHFARRLQIQEQLTQQIANKIQEITGAKGVAVILEAQHLCMMMRGVAKQHSYLKTSVMLGSMHDDSRTRAEFFSLIKLGN